MGKQVIYRDSEAVAEREGQVNSKCEWGGDSTGESKRKGGKGSINSVFCAGDS